VICHVYRRGSLFWGKLRLGDSGPVERFPLGTSNRHQAQAKLARIVEEREKRAAGLLPPQSVSEAREKALAELLKLFLAELIVRGRAAGTVDKYRKTLGKLLVRARWRVLVDADVRSFLQWRAQSGLKAKTLNDLRAAVSVFFDWLVEQGFAVENPFASLKPVKLPPRDSQFRRSLSFAEMGRLLAVAPPHRRLVYLVAAYTGLRRKEMMNLRWADLHLDGEAPFVRVPASISKNRRSASLPLVPDVAAALRAQKPADVSPFAFVLRGLVPRVPTFKKDLAAAEIPFVDPFGRRVDVHALRVTYGTQLTVAGVAPREVMELMRHSALHLTMNLYMDAAQLKLSDAVAKLPRIPLAAVCPKVCPETCPNEGREGSNAVAS
jgi:integrase